jgi:hypothetical protein
MKQHALFISAMILVITLVAATSCTNQGNLIASPISNVEEAVSSTTEISTGQSASIEVSGESISDADKSNGSGSFSAASMISFFTYQGRRYTAASIYRVNELPAIRELVGEKVGYALGNINEHSSRDEYAVELSGSVSGDVYTVNGYSEQFRLCTMAGNIVMFYEAFESSEIDCGSDLFGDCLLLADKWEQVKYVEHSQWDSTHPSEYVYRDLQNATEDDVLSFIAELYSSSFENVYESPERDGFYSNSSQAHLYFFLDDNTRIELRMMQGGYVGYEHFIWHYVRMPGDAFDVIFNACQ